MFFYSAALTLGLLVASPWWLLRMITTQRYREGLAERLGFVPRRLTEGVHGYGFQKPTVWMHAVSVGEVLAAARLFAELESALEGHFGVVISTTTRTGQALAKERFGAERVFYMPLDFAWPVRRYLRALKPSMLILMESELWPRLLHECRRTSIPVAVVNARVSDRSFIRGMKFRWVWKHALRMPKLWLAQSDEDARRLVAMGAHPSSVLATGNLKYDIRAPKQGMATSVIEKLAKDRPIIVFGSTTAASDDRRENDEEEYLADMWSELVETSRPMLLIIAARHPERFKQVDAYFDRFRPTRLTRLLEIDSRGLEGYRADIILLDTIGDLASVYSLATVAFVGGSLVPRGGHNPLEPAQFGIPVIMGPSYENFRDIVGEMIAADGIRIVQDEEELRLAFEYLLTHPAEATALGARGRAVFEQQQGATARTLAAILELL